jgi:hypothetical protein
MANAVRPAMMPTEHYRALVSERLPAHRVTKSGTVEASMRAFTLVELAVMRTLFAAFSER